MKSLFILLTLSIFTFFSCSNGQNVIPASSKITDNFSAATSQQKNTPHQSHKTSPEKKFTKQEIKTVPVVMFHYIRTVNKQQDPMGYNLSFEPVLFEEFLQYLSEKGYHTIHIEDIVNDRIPENPIILTFDDGYKDFYTTAFPLLEKYNFTASVGIITARLDGKQYMTPENIKELHSKGIEIVSHSVNHTDLTLDKNAKTEIEESKKYLEKLLDTKIISFIYPAGKYNNKTIHLLQEAGYKMAFTTKLDYSNVTGNLFELARIRVDNRDGLEGIIKKLEKFK